MITVNGNPTEHAKGVTVTQLLLALGRDPAGRGHAVARNGEVIPQSEWVTTQLADGDRVEILTASQGG